MEEKEEDNKDEDIDKGQNDKEVRSIKINDKNTESNGSAQDSDI
jgi:hypothetical protein